MSRPGVPPISERQRRHSHLATLLLVPTNIRVALTWLRRGPLVTTPLLPAIVRRALLRLGGVKLGGLIYGFDHCFFESPHITVGNGTAINKGCWFEGNGRIDIGEGCLFGPEALILTSVHPLGDDGEISRTPQYRDVSIGNGCWIGARAMIMPGVTIGAGALVAAGAVVTKDCEPGALYAGVPAKKIR
jgi:maltose O-acetyltransferase